MRNLKRLVAAGIPAPAPVLIRNNVLVMDFLGKGGWPAPRLRDVQLSPKKIKVRVVLLLISGVSRKRVATLCGFATRAALFYGVHMDDVPGDVSGRVPSRTTCGMGFLHVDAGIPLWRTAPSPH